MRKSWSLNSLFWKLFFLIWLTNVLVITLSSLYVVHFAQTKLAEQRFADQTRIFVTPFVNAVEESILKLKKLAPKAVGPIKFNNWNTSQIKGARKLLVPKLRRANIRIYNKDGQQIFQRFENDPVNARMRELTFTSASGQKYLIKTWSPRSRHWLPGGFRRLHALQFITLMFGAALVSLMATILIHRPVNKLRNYAQSLSALNFDQYLDTQILKRKDIIGSLARTIDGMARNIGNMIEHRQSLLNDVSHELRAPLARLQAAAALIEQSGKLANSSHVQRLHHECERMNELIVRIIELGKAGSVTQIAALPLNEVVQQTVDDCRYHYPERNIHWQNNVNQGVPVSVDPVLFASAVQNIIENACRHTPTASPIELNLIVEGARALLTIRDYGPGINEAEAEKLLQPFYRANQQMHTEGFGLGLSIVCRALTHCRGKLILNNHPTGGLVVTISIPVSYK